MHNETVAVKQFDGSVKLLHIDLASGARVIVPSDAAVKAPVVLGMFEVELESPELQTVALIATPEGPVLMLDGRRFQPHADTTSIEVRDEGEQSQFVVLDNGVPVFERVYASKFGVGLHPYLNEREDYDFYFWLSRNIKNPRLYERYTRALEGAA